ncbi:MAG: 1-acyl-sn-glycerol-3-phosphate acyltransferase [Clostridia bacterium]|nr:1-acyl-sn-glycerol-3-phosphate acyltransferase [Clostridia bacterium]
MVSEYRQKVLKRREQYELEGRFDEDLEDDPETIELKPNDIDYLSKSILKRIKTFFVNLKGQKLIDNLIKQKQLIIDKVYGIENFASVKGGAMITCNHFHPFDNFAVWQVIKPYMHGKKLYKIIREGNYTNPPKPYGLFFKYANTLPLSSNSQTMKNCFKAVSHLLSKNHKILIYPEQAMWWNYKKPRPLKNGAFNFAVRSNVPVIPVFITMEDSDILDGDGCLVQKLSLHFLPAIYPDNKLTKAENIEIMKNKNFKAWQDVYEKVYGEKLVYNTKEK